MQNIIVFFDIDGTLIDIHQQTNSDDLPACIASLQALGVRFGLNSNRAFEDIIPIAQRFQLDGPFLLENGACLLNAIGEPAVPTANLAEGIPQHVEESLRRCVAHLYPDAEIHTVDTTALVREGATLSGEHFYLNRFRKYSASIHHRFSGNMYFDIAKALTKVLNADFEKSGLALKAFAHEHGATVTVEIPGIDKGTGLSCLRKRFPGARFVAIGDGLGDIALRPHVDDLYAVANAIPQLIAVADTVASLPMTQGVVELLETKVRPIVNSQEHS